MKLNRTFLSAALALAALVGSNLVEARAGQIVQEQSIPQTAIPINTTFNFAAYGGAAGTLTSVELTISETINGQIVIFNFTTSPIHVDAASISAPLTATSPAGDTTVSAAATITNVDIPGGNPFGSSTFSNLVGTLSNSTTYTGASVNPFFGASTVPVSISAPNGVVSGTPLGSDRAYSGSLTAAVSVRLTYNFAGPVVPEPTSSAMFGIGIVLAVGLGWGRRRRELNKLAV
jgi:hypothetical protein